MYQDGDVVYHYETKKNLDVQRWVKSQLLEDQRYYKVNPPNDHIPAKYMASVFLHFLRLLHCNQFGLEGHEQFGEFMRVCFCSKIKT